MIAQYKNLIAATAKYPTKVHNFGLAYCILGFYDEIDEAKEKIQLNAPLDDVRKEIGDVFWYTAAISLEANLSFEEIVYKVIEENQTEYKPLFGMTKKFYRDSKPIDKSLMVNSIVSSLVNLMTFYIALYNEQQDTINIEEEIEEILKINTEKLLNRRKNNTIHGDGDNR